ncbi:glycosyltransferase family 2 protein [Pedobacter roseus]|uniref:Glycosyltransferase n=1 Tax=Pedobacter roseus TaxID=336820 RepID=A0A7G9QI49_9SPHI|nr:glycosyltransferase [Pedobacter roseus]QNN43024.1 glycosyltransferase [Pedobacter roseus]
MKKPLVSIIIPAYNAAKHIAETIQSAISQSWANKEVIVIDDGSTDETLDIIKSFDNQVIKVFQQANKGAAATRNKGLLEAKGDFIQFLDADDILSTDKIEKQVLAIANHTNTLAVCSTVHFDEHQPHALFTPSLYEEEFLKTSDEPIKFLIKLWGGFDGKGSMIQPNAWLIPTPLIRKSGLWNEELSLDDDGEFFARIILNSTKIVKVSDVFNYYRKYKKEGNLSSQKTHKDLSSLLASILSKKKELLSKEDSLAARFAIYRLLYDVAVRSYPQFKDISKKAIHELPLITPLTYKLDFGRKVLSKLASVLGWKSIRLIQYSYQNLANRIR